MSEERETGIEATLYRLAMARRIFASCGRPREAQDGPDYPRLGGSRGAHGSPGSRRRKRGKMFRLTGGRSLLGKVAGSGRRFCLETVRPSSYTSARSERRPVRCGPVRTWGASGAAVSAAESLRIRRARLESSPQSVSCRSPPANGVGRNYSWQSLLVLTVSDALDVSRCGR